MSGFSSACVDDITRFSFLRPFSIHDKADRTLYRADTTVQITDLLATCDVSPTTIHRATATPRMRHELPENG